MNARWIAIVASALGLSACGGSSSSGTTTTPPPPATYTLGGTVNGIAGAGLVLANNGAALAVGAGSTGFTFTNALTAGTAYAVTVQSSPNGQTCSVANGTGTVGTANISNVVVTCSNQSYSVGGSISGLNGSGLVLANGADQLTVASGATSFTLPAHVAFSSTYQVTVATQPTGSSCSVQNGTGTMGAGNVTNITVTCSDQPYKLGGTVSGLVSSGLTLANGTDTVAIAANATSFVFPAPVAYSSNYSVTVSTQPAGMTCTVTSGSGTMPAGDVTNVVVTCSDKSYAIGGPITGLSSNGLELTNGSDHLFVASNQTSFQLPSVAFMSSYNVTVTTQPTGQTCMVSNGSGTMGAGPVNTVVVTCSTNSYTLSGTITGLTSTGLVLTDGTDQVHPAAGAHTFSMPSGIPYNSPYAVTVVTQPPGVSCTVTNGSGTMPGGDVGTVQVACAPFVWTWEAGSKIAGDVTPAIPSARSGQMTWTAADGTFWLFGGATADSTLATGDIDDVWSYDATAKQWTFVSGSTTVGAAPNWGTLGSAAPTNTPGGRHAGTIWVDAHGVVWMFGGIGAGSYLNDLWTYSQTSKQWTWVGGTQNPDDAGTYSGPGLVPHSRAAAASWTDAAGNLWLFGGAYFDTTALSLVPLNDLWKYDPVGGAWTLVSGAAMPTNANYGTKGQAALANLPGARGGAVSWVDGSGKVWLFGGTGLDATTTAGSLNDLWSYNTTTGLWTWVAGADTVGSTGTYGTQGTGSTTNIPSARAGSAGWIDSAGRLWLFGGADLIGGTSFNDLWAFDPTNGQWTWVNGANAPSTSPGVYGTLGTGAGTNQPGARYLSSGWTDSGGHLWLFGGSGYDDGTVGSGNLNDLWMF